MKTKTIFKNKINIITLGCSKNVVDSEVLLSQLRANKINASHENHDNNNNIIVINTCGFIESAKQESINTILHYSKLKKKGDIEKLYVTGCLSQRYKDELTKEIPEVDSWFGTFELPSLLNKLGADYKHELLGERFISTPSHFAYLKIAEGCNHPCSFCAIPLMRGKYKSKPEDLIIKEAKHLAKNGVKELILIAQDTTYYGTDLTGKKQIAQLLSKLAEIEQLEWIRLHYSYPSHFPLDVLNVMKENEKICKYLDIPLQHISDDMLKAMRRGISKRAIEELIDKIRQKIPEITLRTTMLVGHPGEKDRDFEELVEFVEKSKFSRLGVFTYSHEENTHAFGLKDDVSQKLKTKRAEELMNVQQNISLTENIKKEGKTFKVLFDRIDGDYFIGRTEADSPEVDNEVLVPTKNNYARIGDFAKVKITKADFFDLYGNIVK
ncbi:MAG: 30S ribosomal protein S12 methylthiotransferase RimO [Bacteroidetes bacterium]|nr:30S ribosomal protein S12 methylthiotransferase RimO [Bacteroidota bacterium]